MLRALYQKFLRHVVNKGSPITADEARAACVTLSPSLDEVPNPIVVQWLVGKAQRAIREAMPHSNHVDVQFTKDQLLDEDARVPKSPDARKAMARGNVAAFILSQWGFSVTVKRRFIVLHAGDEDAEDEGCEYFLSIDWGNKQ